VANVSRGFSQAASGIAAQWFSFKHVELSQSHNKVLRGIHDFYKGLV
jgi:hypothetical protein